MKKQILFVDDESHFLNGIERILRPYRKEWSVYFAKSVDEALGLVSNIELDLIVTDARMPGKDGFVLLETILRNEKTSFIPIIVLTGSTDDTLKRRALDMGATDLLGKPIVLEDLVARIRNTLRLKSAEDELRYKNQMLEFQVAERTRALERSHQDIVWRLAKAGEYRDEETGNHIIRVGMFSKILAEKLGMKGELVKLIFMTSPLHDIGKIGIPDSILLKPGKLSKEEWEFMKRHCEIGYGILLKKPKSLESSNDSQDGDDATSQAKHLDRMLRMASSIAISHHEKWNGKGYPKGLSGDDIPLEGRIVALADVYDALRSDRPYKSAFSKEKTIAIISEEAGSHFDPDVFDAFMTLIDEFEQIREELKD